LRKVYDADARTISLQRKTAMQLTRLPARYAGFVMPLILSVIMTMVVSAVATWRNLGLQADFASHWLPAWVISWTIAFPTLLLALPLTRRLVRLLVRPA
jgi:hypothetical protein